MRERGNVLSAVGLFLFVALLAGLLLFYPRCPICEANCNRIRAGMTEQDVEDILGGAATGELLLRALISGTSRIAFSEKPVSHKCKLWTAANCEIEVHFADGKVTSASFRVWEAAGDFDIRNPSTWFDW
jgi:hypothetical protein